ncbi:hypothetical protein [Archangium sp.]|uniref:hypothetical protein n=1 Tax=Archangium sp. TaxID=1872627 RepID=UPI00389A68A5
MLFLIAYAAERGRIPSRITQHPLAYALEARRHAGGGQPARRRHHLHRRAPEAMDPRALG